jgi:hypothetical protein
VVVVGVMTFLRSPLFGKDVMRNPRFIGVAGNLGEKPQTMQRPAGVNEARRGIVHVSLPLVKFEGLDLAGGECCCRGHGRKLPARALRCNAIIPLPERFPASR